MGKAKNDSRLLIPLHVSNQILSVGPQHKNHRGGIGAVIDIYSKYFENFQFIRTQRPGSKFVSGMVYLKAIVTLVFKLSFDRSLKIVHIHGSVRGSFYRKYIFYTIAKKIFGKKVFYHIHSGRYPKFYEQSSSIAKKMIIDIINNSDCVICLSNSWKEYYTSNFTPKKIEIVPNVIDFPYQSESTNKDSVLTLLFLGLITNDKGLFDLMDVISQNKVKYYGKIKLVVGGNGEVDKLIDFIEDHELTEMVDFVGWVSSDKKAACLQKSDVYVLPSYFEGLPISVLEAMSYGHPIISTWVGGIPEIVQQNKNGILIEPGDKKAIENAIDYFLYQPEKIDEYGRVSKQLVKKYQPDAVMNKLLNLYNLG